MSRLHPPAAYVQVPPAYAQPPPAYAEAPQEGLAAQLAQMKAMMEQMRLDKERLETEVKRKAEEEAAAVLRAKQEMEAAAARQKEKKELDEVFKLFRDATNIYSRAEKGIDYLWKNVGEEESKFLKSLEASGQTILLAHLDMNTLRCDYNGGSPHNKGVLRFVLTNCHVYQCIYTKFVKNSASTCNVCPITRTETPNAMRENCNSLKTGTFYATTLYSFTNPLNLVHAKILSSIVTIPTISGVLAPHPCQSLWNRVCQGFAAIQDMLISDTRLSDSLKKFESIIRLIPGGYKNGDWKQLDGFFGMYFNEATMEVSELPPPSL
jgi:hypothetical protein